MKQPKRQKRQEKLEDLIRDLERDLANGKSQVAAFEETYKRLDESERLCQELADENRRLAREIAVWQERCARAQETGRRPSDLQPQPSTSAASDARATKGNPDLEEASAAKTQGAMAASAAAAAFMRDVAAHAARTAQTARAWVGENRRVALGLAGVLVLSLAAVLMLRTVELQRPDRAPTPFTEPVAAVGRAPEPAAPASPGVRGVFQTVRPTRVYSAPSENSDRVADIGKGTRVNVVSSQNGWLEIHSKHGRPPGFIRRDAARRMASN